MSECFRRHNGKLCNSTQLNSTDNTQWFRDTRSQKAQQNLDLIGWVDELTDACDTSQCGGRTQGRNPSFKFQRKVVVLPVLNHLGGGSLAT